MFEGSFKVGDRFTWAPYGHEAWPRAWCKIEVTDIVKNGDEILVSAAKINGRGECLHEKGEDSWNDIEHFRQMVGEHESADDAKWLGKRITSDSQRSGGALD